MAKKEIITKIQKCVELAIPFAAAIAGVWGLDISVYCVAAGGIIASTLEFVELFLKN